MADDNVKIDKNLNESKKKVTKANKKATTSLADLQTATEGEISVSKSRRRVIEGLIDVEGDIKLREKDNLTAAGAVGDQVKGAGMSIVQGAEGFVTSVFGGPIGGLINTLSVGFLTRWLSNRKQEKEKQKQLTDQQDVEKKLLDKRVTAMAQSALGEEYNAELTGKEAEAQDEAIAIKENEIRNQFKLREDKEKADAKIIEEKKAQAFIEGKSTEEIAAITTDTKKEESQEEEEKEEQKENGGKVAAGVGLSLEPTNEILKSIEGQLGGGVVEEGDAEVTEKPGFLMSAEEGDAEVTPPEVTTPEVTTPEVTTPPSGSDTEGVVTAVGETNELLKQGFGLSSPPYLETLAEKFGGEVAPVAETGGEIVAESKPGFLMSAEEKIDARAEGGGEVVGDAIGGVTEIVGGEVTGGEVAAGEGMSLEPTNDILKDIEKHLSFMVGNQETAEDRREKMRAAAAAGGVTEETKAEGGDKKEDGKGILGSIGLGDFKFGSLFKKGGVKKLITTLGSTFGGSLSTAFASVGKTFTTTLGPQLMKFAGPLALIAGLALAIKDGLAGWASSEEWGVSKVSGFLGGFFGGAAEGGIKNAFANAGKWALIGAGVGSVIPVVGTIAGGLIGAVIGGILGFIGAEKLAKAFDAVGKWFVDIFDTVVDAISDVWHAIMPKWFTDIDFAWTDIFPTGLVKLFKGEYFTVDIPDFTWYSLFPNFLVEWFKGTAKKLSEKPFSWTDIFPKFLVDFFSGGIADKDYVFSWWDLVPTFIADIIKAGTSAFKETPFSWYSLLPDFLVNLVKGVKVKEGSFEWTDLLPGFITKIVTAGKAAGTTETGEFEWTRLLPSWMTSAWDSSKAMAESAFNWASLLPGWLSSAWGDVSATASSMAEGTFDWKALLPTWLHGAFDSSVALKEMAKGFDWTRLLPDWMASAWDTAKKSEAAEGLSNLGDMFMEALKTLPDKLIALFNSIVEKVISLIPGFEKATDASKYWDITDIGKKQVDTGALTKQVSAMSTEDLSTLKKSFEEEQGSTLGGLENAEAVMAIIAAREAALTKEGGVKTGARGGIVATKPTYLPASGTVVGEHASWSGGKGAYAGGFVGRTPKIPDGGDEAIIPLEGQRGGSILADALAPAIAGAILNELMMARVGGGEGAAATAPTVITDATTVNNVTNNTIVRSPSPSGPNLHLEGRDFVHKIA